MDSTRTTQALLESWLEGDTRALDALVRDNLEWILGQVRRRLGAKLRRRVDSHDLVQDTLLGLLRDGPRFVLRDQRQFRALMARRIENAILRGVEFHTAARRHVDREQPVPSNDSVLTLDPSIEPATRPSEAASEDEMRALVALALELLDPNDRAVIVEREYRQRAFGEIAADFGISEDAARMRFARALPRLAAKLWLLRSGRVADALVAGP